MNENFSTELSDRINNKLNESNIFHLLQSIQN